MRKRNLYGLVGYGLLFLGLIALSSAIFLEKSFPIDTTILESIYQLQSPPMDAVMVSITRLGNPSVTLPVVLIILAALWLKDYRTHATTFLLNCFGGAILSICLKVFFGKMRPDLWDSPIIETTFSYPSGHALGSVVLYGFLAYLLGERLPQNKSLIYVGAASLCLAIGFSRLYLGVHWPTDLLGGYIIGTLWTSLCINLLRKKSQRPAAYQN